MPDWPIWKTFQRPEINDLAWLIWSPPLLETTLGYGGHTYRELSLAKDCNATHAWLKSLDTPHFSAVQRANFRRLGLYFEALLRFCFREGSRAGVIPQTLVANNVQIKAQRGQARTIGELDFLLRDTKGLCCHLEAAVKFYLATSPSGDWHRWWGPNSNDRLGRKMDRLLTHQLPMVQRSDAAANIAQLLPQSQPLATVPSAYLLRGQCFVAANPATAHPTPSGNAPRPRRYHPQQIPGIWMPTSLAMKRDDWQWLALAKMEWLAGRAASDQPARTTVLSPETRLPAMFEVYKKGGDPREASRVMVVPDYWPSTKLPSRKM